jgi:RNA 3'-terminal phosphate cyclase (ATP)
MPSASYAPGRVELELTGGTDVPWSPTIDYIRLAEIPILNGFGYQSTLTVHKRGHYPKGGGHVTMTVSPSDGLSAVKLVERGDELGVDGISHCVKLPSHVAQRQAHAAQEKLKKRGIANVNVAVETYPPNEDQHLGPGSGIALAMKFGNGSILGADSLGQRGKPAERVGEEGAAKLIAEFDSGAALDRHMGDILIPYMAVAAGQSEIRVSEITTHTITNITVAETLAGVKFSVQGEPGQPGIISVKGIGLRI